MNLILYLVHIEIYELPSEKIFDQKVTLLNIAK